ncbi:hypothetical protein D9M68_839050 [compost metagenome]
MLSRRNPRICRQNTTNRARQKPPRTIHRHLCSAGTSSGTRNSVAMPRKGVINRAVCGRRLSAQAHSGCASPISGMRILATSGARFP